LNLKESETPEHMIFEFNLKNIEGLKI
jgi:hypothetical protein